MEELKKKFENCRVVQTGGVSTIGILGVAFVILKIMGYITWSWWWVLAPFWIPFIIAIILIGILLLVIKATLKSISNNDNKYTVTSTENVSMPKEEATVNTTVESTKKKSKKKVKKDVNANEKAN